MKFLIEKEILQKALTSVEGIINPKNSDTVLANVLLEAKKNQIFLTTSDSDISIKSFADAEVNEEGSVMLPAKKFSHIIRSLNAGNIIVSLNKNNSIQIKTEDKKTNFTIVGSEAKDYPTRMVMPAIDLFSLPQPLVKKMIQKTFYAAAHHDDSRFVFNGIFFEANSNSIIFVATDGRRLAYNKTDNKYKIELSEGIIIPSKIISEIQKLLLSENDLFFNTSENQIFFKLNNTEISCRLIQGKFPDYKKVIPSSSPHSIKIEKEKLMGALKRVSLMASDASHQIKLSFIKDILRIEAQTPDIGSAQEDISLDQSLTDIAIGFNSLYLIDALKEIDSNAVDFKFSDSEMPAILKPEDEDNYISVIMPLKIN